MGLPVRKRPHHHCAGQVRIYEAVPALDGSRGFLRRHESRDVLLELAEH